MTNWLIEQTLICSFLIAILLLANKRLNATLGALHAYQLWFVIPFSLTLPLLTQPFSKNITNYVITNNYAVELPLAPLMQVSELGAGQLMFATWAIGSIFILSFIMIAHFKTLGELKLKTTATPPAVANHAKLQCFRSNNLTSPIVTGVIKHKLVLPSNFEDLYNPQQQQLILNHELGHLRHKDIYWNLLALITLVVFWFNPLFWWGYKVFRQQQELACDQQVLNNKSLEQRKEYAHAMLIGCVAPHKSVLTHLNYNEDLYMKERIKQINKHADNKVLKLLPSLTIFALLALAGNSVFAKPEVTHQKPLSRVEPIYPKQAATENIEGYVQLSFDIETDGSVSNLHVIKSEPESVFDKAALKAVKKWRYHSAIHRATNVQVQLDFLLSEDSSYKAPAYKGTEVIAVTEK